MRLYCATSNPGKLAEFQAGAPPGIEILPAGSFDCPETGSSFEQNAAQKALCYAEWAGDLVFADDSGLEVDCLSGEPGIRSARYAGQDVTDADNRALLLEKLKRAQAPPPAHFVCVLALARPGRLIATFRGLVDGVILDAPRGKGGFGYDPLFYFPPLGKTFAELDPPQKFIHSHRGHAFRAMLAWLSKAPELQGVR